MFLKLKFQSGSINVEFIQIYTSHMTVPLTPNPPSLQQCPPQAKNYQRPCRAFEVSSPVSLSASNTSSRADGAQMDSKGGMSLKIHGTHHDQGEWRGVGIKH